MEHQDLFSGSCRENAALVIWRQLSQSAGLAYDTVLRIKNREGDPGYSVMFALRITSASSLSRLDANVARRHKWDAMAEILLYYQQFESRSWKRRIQMALRHWVYGWDNKDWLHQEPSAAGLQLMLISRPVTRSSHGFILDGVVADQAPSAEREAIDMARSVSKKTP